MGLQDKIQNAGEQLSGKAKETTGRATDDPDLEAEGQGEQAFAKVKKVGEDVKDVFR